MEQRMTRAEKLLTDAENYRRAFKTNILLQTMHPSKELLSNEPGKKARTLEQLRYDRFLDPKCRLNRIEEMLLSNYDRRKPTWELF